MHPGSDEPGRLLDGQIIEALRRVYDPCSVASGAPVSIYDLGLVREWHLDAGHLEVVLCVTSGGCTMAPHFASAAEVELARLPGVESVNLRVVGDVLWLPEMMTDEGRSIIDNARSSSHAAVPVRPRQWKESLRR